MTSTEMYALIRARYDYLRANKPEAKDENYRRYIRPICNACLEHCKRVKGMWDMQEEDVAIFSDIPLSWAWESEEVDSTIGACIRAIWSTQNEWCCALDFGDAGEPWGYVTFIYDQLMEMLDYTERNYGVFEIPGPDEP